MKSFQNKSAMTLVELIISVFVSSAVIVIVMTFMSMSLNELRITNEATKAIDSSFSLKDIINRYVKSWYNYFTIYWTETENQPFTLENWIWDWWYLFWIVDDDTKKLQKNKIYWNNFIWYRSLSLKELTDIETNSWVIYTYSFHNDKILKWVRIKDFKPELYNSGWILDIYMSTILVNDENNFGKNMSDVFFDPNDIAEFNFDF